MELKKLSASFYDENPTVENALDYYSDDGLWDQTKIRGHGVVNITVNNLMFAIPVRSNVTHSASYILLKNTQNRRIKGMGLDYSKALLIRKPEYVSDENFNLKVKDAGKKLVGKEKHVTDQFEKYVKKYIHAVTVKDQNILSDQEYVHTTLINYHADLGI
ncbi:hypothetical protein MW374_004766 [Vibrio parahaemolyticus]|uniref:type III toxin-antitoxin system TenpIN family toxin n=1 Tax=Vibrio cholerae TaxID=666 RepID=UPI00155E737C|nr:hypothetical protein [Vibrio cholerae]EJB8530826.1 hypothetical protein [Vibrio parahaemolyticus]NOE08879.1 hypothetical protein [Vibrio cholerae]